jgi:hypothetical protein
MFLPTPARIELSQHPRIPNPVRTRVPTTIPAPMGRLRGLGQSYSPPSYFDLGWASVFVAGCEAIGASPYDVAGLIIGESGWNPGAQGGSPCAGGGYAVGLNQLCPVSQGVFTNDYTPAQYLQLTVSQQLPYCFQYWQNVMSNAGVVSVSGEELYWLNWLPATFVPYSSDSYVIQSQGDPYYDPSLDVGNKGYITLGDLGTRISNMEAQNPNLWSYLWPQITLAGGPLAVVSWPWLAAGSALAGFAGFYIWKRRGGRGKPSWVPSWV